MRVLASDAYITKKQQYSMYGTSLHRFQMLLTGKGALDG